MFDETAFTYMAPAQRRRISAAGVQARYLKRLAADPPDYPPIPEGLRMGAIFLDFRTPEPQENIILLFQKGDYHNRYRWMLNNEKQRGLVGWHDAVRKTAKIFRPLLRIEV